MARSIYCYTCKEVKENPSRGYCHACNSKRSKDWKLKTGRIKKHRTGKCACGNPFAPYSKSYCTDCTAKRDKQWRKDHPETPEQRAKRIARVRARFIPKVRKKVRLDPDLWEKPITTKRKGLINGIKVCGRPNCTNWENLFPNGWCRPCHAAYQRERRKYYETHRSEETIIRSRVRALTRSYINNGRLVKMPCEVCKETNVDAHHDDYNKPLDVRWLCKKHHREHHKSEINLKETLS